MTQASGRRPLNTFKYRNPTATILPGQTIRIHPGAWKGLNIEPRREGTSARRAQRPRKRSGNRRGL